MGYCLHWQPSAVSHCIRYYCIIMCSPGLPNGLKGLQPRAPKAEGPPKPRQKKIHIEFDRRHAMQCFMCVQCMVIVDCRVSTVFTRTGNSHHGVSVCVCICVCVCVSHAGIVSKRLNVGSGSCKQHHVIAQGL